jgi:hypothetical protein
MAIRRKGATAPARRSTGNVAWEKAPTTLTRRCAFMEIYGDTGTGRTTLALTAPGPIGLIHAAEKIEGIVQPVAREKEVRMYNFGGVFRGSPDTISEKAHGILTGAQNAWYDAIDDWAKSVILDTHTELWELIRLARFGTLTPRGTIAHMYGPVNAEWRSMFKHFREQDHANVVLIGQTKDEYKNDKQTGKTVRAGQKEIPFMADVIVRTSRSPDGGFLATVEKGWWNADMEGLELEDENITFSMIMSLVTETEESEWE